jgi:hypothetical protein
VTGRTQRWFFAAVLILGLGATGSLRAETDIRAAHLRLVVRHALDTGRLIVRIGETAFFSTPLAPADANRAGSVERLLSIPSGLQTLIVELRDTSGKVTARKEVRGMLVPGTAAVLDVAAANRQDLSLELKAAP